MMKHYNTNSQWLFNATII